MACDPLLANEQKPLGSTCQCCIVVSKVIHKFFKTICRVELVTAGRDVVAKALLEKDMGAVVPLI
jgi:hypothetical protein